MERKIQEAKYQIQRIYEEKKNLRGTYGDWEDKIKEKLSILIGNNEEYKI